MEQERRPVTNERGWVGVGLADEIDGPVTSDPAEGDHRTETQIGIGVGEEGRKRFEGGLAEAGERAPVLGRKGEAEG